ncbi:diguanylate cyclase [Labrenzia sp. PHM005]|uniref:sensor domain-containing diguanylate cyclase n=1 Tax=Labrenzia sp. PHM005 TaxID=2590016 RepID=UPI001AD8CD03|nr:diguanylate cyclase [Labrenzia sp. PHM005]
MRSSFNFRSSVMAKILTIVSFCIFFVVAASGVGIYQIRQIGQEIQFVAEAEVPLTEALGHVTTHRLEQSLLMERMMRLRANGSYSTKKTIAEAEARFSVLSVEIKEEFGEAMEIARGALLLAKTDVQVTEFTKVINILSKIAEENIRYGVTSQEALDHARLGQIEKAEAVLANVEEAHTAFDRELENLLFRVQALAKEAADAALAYERQALQQTISISLGSAVLSFLFAMVIGRRTIAAPLLEVVNALYSLSRGDYEANLSSKRQDEIGDIGRAFNAFKEQMLQMQKQEQQETQRQQALNQEIKLLSELNEWLQSSNSLDELFHMVSKFMTKLLPDCRGSIYVYSNSRDVLDGACSWNGATLEDHIRPDTCWGLRRGRTYVHGDNVINFTCDHVDPREEGAYVCLPILAHGETVGLMHLTPAEELDSTAFAKRRKLAQMAAEQISLAIANTRMRDELHNQSIRDPLTGLYNRRHFTDSLRKQLEASKYKGHPVSLVSVDVDHFKKFNDNHGHDAGDMVLRAVGTALEDACDGDQLPCRLGGEEFMILLPEVSEEFAADFAETLRSKVEAITVRYGEKNLPRITISLGVAAHPKHGTMPQELIKSADDALYASKAGGRNQVTLASSSDEEEADTEADLRAFVADAAADTTSYDTDSDQDTPTGRRKLAANS